MSTAPRPSRRRARAASQPHQNDVASILARRDELDGVKADQRDRENALVDEYLSATAEETDIDARRDAVFADLEERRRKAVQDAEQAVEATRKRRAATIVELHKRRSVQQLGIMLKLPRRRIDKLIRLHNEHTVPQIASVDGHGSGSQNGPDRRNKGQHGRSPAGRKRTPATPTATVSGATVHDDSRAELDTDSGPCTDRGPGRLPGRGRSTATARRHRPALLSDT